MQSRWQRQGERAVLIRRNMFGRLFTIKGEKIYGLYCNTKGASYAEPPGTKHLAHVLWRNPLRGQDSNIDYFAVKENSELEPSEIVHINQIALSEGVEDRCGVRYQILSDSKAYENLVRAVAARDIGDFLIERGKTRDKSGLFSRSKRVKSRKEENFKSSVEYVSGVKGLPVRNVMHARISVEGKQDYYPGCLLDINLDFAKWCISGISPDGKIAGWNSCDYCYASHTHAGYPGAFYVDKKELKAQIKDARMERGREGKPTRYLRLGKRTECGAKMFRESLVNTLEVCADEGIKCIFPTKFLEFDRDVAELLKRTDSTLLVSLGNDELERGAVLHGRTQEARIEDSLKYLEAGARAIPYVLVDATLENGGRYFEKNFKEVLGKFPQMQIIPIRLRHTERAVKILGGWHNLIQTNYGRQDLFGHCDGHYEKGNDGTRIAVSIHPSLGNLVGDNGGDVRMCHHSSCREYCGMCFMTGEKGFARPAS